MDEQYLSRGKRLDGDQMWIVGSYCCIGPAGKDRHYIIPRYASAFYGIEVAPSTVGRCTGLTDSECRKVFDGDILRFSDPHADINWIGRIEFGNPNSEYTWGYQLVHISGDCPNIDTLLWFDMEDAGVECEVIGNIYDNPELLGGGRKGK